MSIPYLCEKSEAILAKWVLNLPVSLDKDTRPILIGIGGPGGSGKSRFTAWLCQQLPGSVVLELDDFRLPRHQRPPHAPFGSHPQAIDLDRLFETLKHAQAGNNFNQPHFDREQGKVLRESPLPAAPIILLDGEITAYSELNPYLDYLFLVQTSLWNQWRTRLHRDRCDRQCSLRKTLHIFWRSNVCDHPKFSRHAEKRADLILYRKLTNQFHLRKSHL